MYCTTSTQKKGAGDAKHPGTSSLAAYIQPAPSHAEATDNMTTAHTCMHGIMCPSICIIIFFCHKNILLEKTHQHSYERHTTKL